MTKAAEKEDLYKDYRDKVSGYINRRLNGNPDAEDLVSEVFLKVYEKFDSFDQSRASVSTWIYTITKNTLIDYYRTNRPYSELPLDLSDGISTDDGVLSKEALNELTEALKRLEKRSRDLIILKYAKKMTLKDIAEKMGISYAYVKILHNSALQSLRTLMS